MIKIKTDEYNFMINKKELTIELLLSCLANIEFYINTYAYLQKKWKNTQQNSYSFELKEFILYRSLITSVVKMNSNLSAEQIKDIINSIDKNDYVTNSIRDAVIELIKSKDYKFI